MLVEALLSLVVAATPTPGPTPTLSFYGVTLGETMDDVRDQFGPPQKQVKAKGDPVWMYPLDEGDAGLIIEFLGGGAHRIMVATKSTTSHLVDPFGIRLGDPVDRLRSVRGEPSKIVPDDIWVYGPEHGVSWTYTQRANRIDGIWLEGELKALPVPSPGPTPWSNLSLGGVSLGEPNSEVVDRLGQPVMRFSEQHDFGPMQAWTYYLDSGHLIFVVISVKDAVTSVAVRLNDVSESAFSDPFGIHLGDVEASLRSARGDPENTEKEVRTYTAGTMFLWSYDVKNGKIFEMRLSSSAPISGPLPDVSVGPDGRDGSSIDKAIIAKGDGVLGFGSYEPEYVASLRCDGLGTWQTVKHASLWVVSKGAGGGGTVSEWDVRCSTSGRTTTFYFDQSGLPAR